MDSTLDIQVIFLL